MAVARFQFIQQCFQTPDLGMEVGIALRYRIANFYAGKYSEKGYLECTRIDWAACISQAQVYAYGSQKCAFPRHIRTGDNIDFTQFVDGEVIDNFVFFWNERMSQAAGSKVILLICARGTFGHRITRVQVRKSCQRVKLPSSDTHNQPTRQNARDPELI